MCRYHPLPNNGLNHPFLRQKCRWSFVLVGLLTALLWIALAFNDTAAGLQP